MATPYYLREVLSLHFAFVAGRAALGAKGCYSKVKNILACLLLAECAEKKG
jgi:hypothetical protein